MKKILKIGLGIFAVLAIVGAISKDKPALENKSTPAPAVKEAVAEKTIPPSKNQPIQSGPESQKMIIGIEYGFDGIAKFFTGLGIPAAKLLPEKFDWSKMQPDITKPVNWALSDDLIREYQNAGFKEIILGLRTLAHDSNNKASYSKERPIPKPENEALYVNWIKGMVERYDKDGKDDMPGLLYPIRYYEIEVELSSYTPEPVSDYIKLLGMAYKAAHEAYPSVIVAHTAFLPMTAFDTNPSAGGYEAAFAAMRIPDKTHNLADMRKILDHPELFDRVNFHALEDPVMIERAVKWLNYEMDKRGYRKPILISDTEATPFISYGNATSCKGAFMGIMVWPAKEADRCRLADYFNKILDGDQKTIAWKNAFLAGDTVKRVVIAAHSGVELIDTAFVMDLPILSTKLGFAGAGNGGFSGFVTERYNIFTKQHTVTEYRPAFYALKQVAKLFSGQFTITKEPSEANVRIYKVQAGGKTTWIAWVSSDQLFLPDDMEPEKTISLPLASGAIVTAMSTTSANPTQKEIASSGEKTEIMLTSAPVYITGK